MDFSEHEIMERITPGKLFGDQITNQFRIVSDLETRIREATSESLVVDLSDAEWFTPAFLAPMSVLLLSMRM